MTISEVIKELNKRGLLVAKPQPDLTIQYEWTVLGKAYLEES